MKIETIEQKRLRDLEEQVKIQCSNGNWNYDSYMMGLANGLILARHTIRGDEGTPPFLTKPKEWLCRRRLSKKPKRRTR